MTNNVNINAKKFLILHFSNYNFSKKSATTKLQDAKQVWNLWDTMPQIFRDNDLIIFTEHNQHWVNIPSKKNYTMYQKN